ncbi:MAG: hypothetical protein ACM4D3_13425 [Candidatus Sericytochromatia bacterium]
MEIVLGVSMTPTTVGMVVVESAHGDGVTVDHDVFDITGSEDSATPSAPHQVIAAIVGTRQSALAAGHTLAATGVTCSDGDQASALRKALTACGIDDVFVFSELHAAGALAQAAGRVVGYDTSALLLVDPDSATLALVDTGDGSIVKVCSRSLHGVEVMAVLREMVADLQSHTLAPEGIFIVGAGVDVSSVKEQLHSVVALPISAPDDAELAMARGAALAAARAPRSEASTIALAYAQDPDETTAGDPVVDPTVTSELAATPGAAQVNEVEPQPAPSDGDRKPFLLVGSSLTAIFLLGVVTLVISLAVSIRPTADQRPSPGESAVLPSTAAPASPAPPPVPQAQPVPPPPPAPASAPPAPETIPAPVPVVQQAPAVPQAPQAPRTVVAQPPSAKSPAPAAPAPAAVPPAAPPAPVAPPAAPLPVLPAPAPVVLPPILQLPFLPHPVYPPPVQAPPYYPPPQQQPPYYPPQQQSPYYPPVQPWPQAPPQQSPRYPQYLPAPGYGPGRGADGPRNGSRLPWWLYPGD